VYHSDLRRLTAVREAPTGMGQRWPQEGDVSRGWADVLGVENDCGGFARRQGVVDRLCGGPYQKSITPTEFFLRGGKKLRVKRGNSPQVPGGKPGVLPFTQYVGGGFPQPITVWYRVPWLIGGFPG